MERELALAERYCSEFPTLFDENKEAFLDYFGDDARAQIDDIRFVFAKGGSAIYPSYRRLDEIGTETMMIIKK
jgi:hypothetical protein